MPRGFILHPTYYVEKNRPVLHLFGRLESGETFVVRDDRRRPHFYVRTAEVPALLRLTGPEVAETHLATPEGEPVSKVSVGLPTEIAPLRDRLEAVGIRTFEADLPFPTMFLMDAGLRGALEIEGEPRPGRLIRWIYQNPKLAPATLVPELSVLSLDIETDPEAREIYALALWGRDLREVFVVHPQGASGAPFDSIVPEDPEAAEGGEAGGPSPARVHFHPTEEALLRAFALRLRECDPDLLTGWNVIDFDLRVLQNRFDAHHLPFQLGRADLACRLLLDRTVWGTSRAIFPGRVVLDGLALLRGAGQRLEDYRLETAAREILGQGKSIAAEDRGLEIQRLYREDLPRFLRYNLNDARLVWRILEKKALVPLAIRQSLLTGLPLDRTQGSIAAFDFLYLTELHRRGQVAPTTDAGRPISATRGGFVLATEPGIFDQVAVLDYRSLYPSIIRTFRLDPLSLVSGAADAAAVTAPNGARFRREDGILPEILDRLFPLRETLLAEGDALGATALKLLMNSFYGVLATPRCRFYSPETANAITSFGQQTLIWTQEACEARGHRVLYGDTDSIFVETGAAGSGEAAEVGQALAAEINRMLAARLQKDYGVESRLHLRFDRLFRRLLLPGLRGSAEGSKKRYAGLVGEGNKEKILFVGLESVRRDWTDLAKLFQRELILRTFHRQPMEEFVRDFLARLRAGEMDGLLVYRKALRKPEEEYQRTTPPHVQAARRSVRGGSRIVRYLMTTAGPEPEGELRHPPDREHYVEKQLRPVAESILALTGSSWEAITGGQQSLPF